MGWYIGREEERVGRNNGAWMAVRKEKDFFSLASRDKTFLGKKYYDTNTLLRKSRK